MMELYFSDLRNAMLLMNYDPEKLLYFGKQKKALKKQQFINLILLHSTETSFVHFPHFANGKISKLI